MNRYDARFKNVINILLSHFFICPVIDTVPHIPVCRKVEAWKGHIVVVPVYRSHGGKSFNKGSQFSLHSLLQLKVGCITWKMEVILLPYFLF